MSLALRQSPLPGRIIPLEECVCTYRFGTQNNFERALSQQVGSICDARECKRHTLSSTCRERDIWACFYYLERPVCGTMRHQRTFERGPVGLYLQTQVKIKVPPTLLILIHSSVRFWAETMSGSATTVSHKPGSSQHLLGPQYINISCIWGCTNTPHCSLSEPIE